MIRPRGRAAVEKEQEGAGYVDRQGGFSLQESLRLKGGVRPLRRVRERPSDCGCLVP
jgi:hypothetical protein